MSATEIVWTWLPLCVAAAIFVALISKRSEGAISAAVILADITACAILSRVMIQIGGGTDFDLWSALSFGSIDYACAVLLLACGEPILAIIFGLSVLCHIAFSIHDMFMPPVRSYADAVALYNARIAYGWTAFSLTILPSLVLMTGGRGGGKRRNRKRSHVHAHGWRGLAVFQGFRTSRRRMRG